MASVNGFRKLAVEFARSRRPRAPQAHFAVVRQRHKLTPDRAIRTPPLAYIPRTRELYNDFTPNCVFPLKRMRELEAAGVIANSSIPR